MTTNASPVRALCGMAAFSIALGCAVPAFAEAAPPPKIDAADTAWMISATALVLMMTIPGLALFYCGMVRKKNVLATMAQSLLCAALCSVLWAIIGYTLAFGSEGTILGNLDRLFLHAWRLELASPGDGDLIRATAVLPPELEGALERLRAAATAR